MPAVAKFRALREGEGERGRHPAPTPLLSPHAMPKNCKENASDGTIMCLLSQNFALREKGRESGGDAPHPPRVRMLRPKISRTTTLNRATPLGGEQFRTEIEGWANPFQRNKYGGQTVNVWLSMTVLLLRKMRIYKSWSVSCMQPQP